MSTSTLEQVYAKHSNLSATGFEPQHRAGLEAVAKAIWVGAWEPIAGARKDGTDYLLYAPELVDPDTNRSGVVDGHWLDGVGWQAAIWNNYQDCYDCPVIHPTHFQLKRGPELV